MQKRIHFLSANTQNIAPIFCYVMYSVQKLIKNTKGATAIEYGLIVSGIAIVIIGGLGLIGDDLSNTFGSITDAFDNGVQNNRDGLKN